MFQKDLYYQIEKFAIEPDIAAHICNPSPPEAEAGGSLV